YSDARTKEWVQQGCRSAGIGCLECKQPVIEAVLAELNPIRERAQHYLSDPTQVRKIMRNGAEKARHLAQETLADVRNAMGLDYT
ncbi:MAG: tryptophan--tRNA ligase, partial [Burkholderiales bacterium]